MVLVVWREYCLTIGCNTCDSADVPAVSGNLWSTVVRVNIQGGSPLSTNVIGRMEYDPN